MCVKEIRSWMWSPLPVCEEDFRGFAAKHGLFFMPPNDGSEVNRTGMECEKTEKFESLSDILVTVQHPGIQNDPCPSLWEGRGLRSASRFARHET